MRSQADAAMQRYGLNPGNSNFQPYMPQNPSMFGQMQGLAGMVGGQGAGDMVALMGALANNPAVKNFLPGLSGAVTNMMGTMPIGMNQDVGNFMVNRMMGTMGVGMTPPPSAPSDFMNIQQAQAFNQAAMQHQANFSNAPSPTLMELTAGDSAQSLRMLQGLANADIMRQDGRFKGAFETMSAISGVNMDDPVLQEAIKLGRTGDTAKADAFMKQNQAVVDKAIKAANEASGLNSFASNVAPMLLNAGISVDNPVIGGLLEVALNATGADRDPRLFAPAAAQSLAMLGGLNMAGFSGGPGFAAEKVAMGLGQRMTQTGGIGGLDMVRGMTLTRELSRQGMLTTGGIDTFGNLDTDQVKALEETIARQLENFKGISDLAKRTNMTMGEIAASMKQIYGNDYSRQLESAIGEAERSLRADPTNAGKSDEFIRSESLRRANADLVQPIKEAVGAGAMMGLNQHQSMGMIMAATDMAKGMGLGGRAGVDMMMSAGAMVNGMRTMGISMDPSQALAQAADTAQVYMNTSDGMGLGNLLKATRELSNMGLEQQPGYTELLQGLKDGTKGQQDVQNFLSQAGVTQGMMPDYQGARNAAMGFEANPQAFGEASRASARRQVTEVINDQLSKRGASLSDIRTAVGNLAGAEFDALKGAKTDEELAAKLVNLNDSQLKQLQGALGATGEGRSLAFLFDINKKISLAGGDARAVYLSEEDFRLNQAATERLKDTITEFAPTGSIADKINAAGGMQNMGLVDLIGVLQGATPQEQAALLDQAKAKFEGQLKDTTDDKERRILESSLEMIETAKGKLAQPTSTSPNPAAPPATGAAAGGGSAPPGTNAGTPAAAPVGATPGGAAGGNAQSTPNPTAAAAATGTGAAADNQEMLTRLDAICKELKDLNALAYGAVAMSNGAA
jgi:hypothetical protein